ncbi:reverse transcriptase domain-containing protein [Tanacetum coccineum]
MIRGNTNRKRPREQSEQWTSNEISFPSMPGCQLVDSPIILEALIEGFWVCRIYVDGGSSSEVMSEKFMSCGLHYPLSDKVSHSQWDCNNDNQERNPLRIPKDRRRQGRKSRKTWGPNGIIHPSPVSSKKYTQAGKKDKVEDESLEKSSRSKPQEKVTWNSPLHFRTRAQNIPSHRAESAKEAEHSSGQKKSNLNKACPKDLYPLPEFDWKIKSLMGFKYKCFLDAYKGYHQIQMAKKDKEKTAFHTDEGVFCNTKMPFGLKNVGETYQRLFNTIFKGQMGRNLEAYMDDMVIKSKTELEMMKDIEETLLTLKKVNMKLNPKKCSFEMEEGKFLGYIVTSEGIRSNPKKTKAVVNKPSPSDLKQMQRLSGKLTALNRFLSKAAERALPCLDTLKKCTNIKDFHWTTEAEEAFQAMKKLIAELPTLTTPKKEEELMVYLSAANKAVNKPISQILNNQEATGRLAKWGVELKAYDIKYSLRSAIKGQVLADFLADAMTEDNPTQVKTDRPDDTLAEGESMEEQEDTKTKAPENLRAKIDIWKLYTDGASNEHRSGAGLILIDLEGAEYSYALQLNFANSNNDAEYEALLAGLRIATKMKVKNACICGFEIGSKPGGGVVRSKRGKTKKYKEKSLEMIRSFSNFQISHIPREENRKADALSKLAVVQ